MKRTKKNGISYLYNHTAEITATISSGNPYYTNDVEPVTCTLMFLFWIKMKCIVCTQMTCFWQERLLNLQFGKCRLMLFFWRKIKCIVYTQMAYFWKERLLNLQFGNRLLLKLPKTDVSEIVLYFTKNVNVINMSYSWYPKLPSGNWCIYS